MRDKGGDDIHCVQYPAAAEGLNTTESSSLISQYHKRDGVRTCKCQRRYKKKKREKMVRGGERKKRAKGDGVLLHPPHRQSLVVCLTTDHLRLEH